MSITFNQSVLQLLNEIETAMQQKTLWQSLPPKPEAFLSEQPFALDMMSCYEWLQWIFLPRMRALIDADATLPRNFVLHPYFEEALKEEDEALVLLSLIKQLDQLVKQ
ncbi:uncharacterized protein YqcC (DUF446 family) [Orbus hercynius]|uniref:Uncharacterized protein YqcC (DUF446 family) n=1 Tax=Orbus hercynius TaxID=593135 RepID=A0A495RHE5_9GAMM|nr:YqcC family protein [Orbus hercynius]RKS86845.1 uncharacterized protein YqcC (DUF446 family) [Orbus hercynius]